MLLGILKESFQRMYDALPDLPAWRINFLYISVILVLFGILMTIMLAVKKKIRFFTGIFSILSAALIILICLFYPYVDMLYAHPSGNPADEAASFLNALSEGRISDAYDVLYGREPGVSGDIQTSLTALYEDRNAAMYLDYLKAGYGFEYTGDMMVDDLTASVPVRITYSDLNAASEGIDGRPYVKLDDIVQSHTMREVYKDGSSYQDWVVEEAYRSAYEEVLSTEPVKTSADIRIGKAL